MTVCYKIRSTIYYTFMWLSNTIIDFLCKKVYSEKVVFNCAWEDPMLDIEALEINEHDNLLCITSAGCNILNYLLQNPRHIYAVDLNPCQNALLELKIASIRELDYATYWQMWGRGRLDRFSDNVYPRLRIHLSKEAQHFWDNHKHYFDGKGMRKSFYWRGCTGVLAYILHWYFRLIGISKHLDQMFYVETIEEQEKIYETYVHRRFWNPVFRRLISSSWSLSFLFGVPTTQQDLMGQPFRDFMENAFGTVLTKLSLKSNYFYRVYFYGEYTKECCPEYLKEENFNRLKDGLIDRITIRTTTITEFLKSHSERNISRFILLDHMDWLATQPDVLSEEWQQIFDHSTDQCRYIWRGISTNSMLVDNTRVILNGKATTVKELIKYNQSLAEKLHKIDRVHTYSAFFIAYRRH